MAVATRLRKPARPAIVGARHRLAQGDSVSRPYIRCAFCGGSGKDPFGLLSPLALCAVCQGKGQVKLEEPVVECAFCSGKGVYPLGNRLTCTACGGKGMLTVAGPTVTCPECQGTGQDPESGSDLYCLHCRGAGVVANKTSTLSLRVPARPPGHPWRARRPGLGGHGNLTPRSPRFARDDGCTRNPELKKTSGEGAAQTSRSAKTKPGTYSRPYRKSPSPHRRRQG